jgi:uncharacterized repeat protein (TIGR04138 family)
VREALDHTIQSLSKPKTGPDRHVSGHELLDGIRVFACEQFGPLTKTVLNRWGIRETADFGEIVFNLVDKGILGKTDDDRREDFRNGYDFEEAFVHPFLPSAQLRSTAEPSARDTSSA